MGVFSYCGQVKDSPLTVRVPTFAHLAALSRPIRQRAHLSQSRRVLTLSVRLRWWRGCGAHRVQPQRPSHFLVS
jgi:hypothetical protein